MNQYQACAHYHTANGFLPTKHAEEFEERKEALIKYTQICVLNKVARAIKAEEMSENTLNHLLQTDEEDSDELEEAIQIITDKEKRHEIDRWYVYNGGNTRQATKEKKNG